MRMHGRITSVRWWRNLRMRMMHFEAIWAFSFFVFWMTNMVKLTQFWTQLGLEIFRQADLIYSVLLSNVKLFWIFEHCNGLWNFEQCNGLVLSSYALDRQFSPPLHVSLVNSWWHYLFSCLCIWFFPHKG